MAEHTLNTSPGRPTDVKALDRAVRYIEEKRKSGQDFAWLVSTNRKWLLAGLRRQDAPEDLKRRIRELLRAANVPF